jgi:uncharacterized membrane protein YbaN (DUF454 family)
VRIVLIVVGTTALGLGIVGIALPLLPTTPFLLLAAACFARSSQRLYTWLIHHRWFGDYIRHYREHRAIPLRAKVVSLVVMWSVVAYTGLGVVTAWWLRALLGVIALGVTLHILHLKTLTPELLMRSESTTDTQQESQSRHSSHAMEEPQ